LNLAAKQSSEEEDLILHVNFLKLVKECILILFWNISLKTWNHCYNFSNTRWPCLFFKHSDEKIIQTKALYKTLKPENHSVTFCASLQSGKDFVESCNIFIKKSKWCHRWGA